MNMTKEQKELLNNILSNKDFLAEVLKAAAQKPKYGKLNIGGIITVAGIVWRKFKEDADGNSYVLADDITKTMRFGDTNDWRASDIRGELCVLAQKIKEELGENALIPITVDLLSMDGLDDYGEYVDDVSLLTLDLYRHNRKNIKDIGKAFWLNTPDSTPSGYGSGYVQCVGSDGSVFCDGCDWNGGGVRPFFVLRSETESSNL